MQTSKLLATLLVTGSMVAAPVAFAKNGGNGGGRGNGGGHGASASAGNHGGQGGFGSKSDTTKTTTLSTDRTVKTDDSDDQTTVKTTQTRTKTAKTNNAKSVTAKETAKAKKLANQPVVKGASAYAKDDDQALPPGIQMNLEKGKALPTGLAKTTTLADDQELARLNSDDYTVITTKDGQKVVVLDKDVYDDATVVKKLGDGIVEIKVNDRILDVVEDSRVIVDVVQ